MVGLSKPTSSEVAKSRQVRLAGRVSARRTWSGDRHGTVIQPKCRQLRRFTMPLLDRGLQREEWLDTSPENTTQKEDL